MAATIHSCLGPPLSRIPQSTSSAFLCVSALKIFFLHFLPRRVFDRRLTLSIPRNSLPPNPLRVRLRENFDTLSVYIEGRCVNRLCAPGPRAYQTCNDSADMKKQTIQEPKSRAVEKHRDLTHSTPQRFNGFRPV